MRVLLLQDVYKLGRAGDLKKVADGYGRNYLIPQGLAVLATPGAAKQADYIKRAAASRRAQLNQELGSVAEQLTGLELAFAVKAGETGKLYGSVTNSMIAEAIEKKTGIKIDRKQVDVQPIKLLGIHKADLRLTIDLIPEITIIVHREGEPPESVMEEVIEEAASAEDFAELKAELDSVEEAEATSEKEGQTAIDETMPLSDEVQAASGDDEG
jgi:large subunit ribosomal protein L9